MTWSQQPAGPGDHPSSTSPYGQAAFADSFREDRWLVRLVVAAGALGMISVAAVVTGLRLLFSRRARGGDTLRSFSWRPSPELTGNPLPWWVAGSDEYPLPQRGRRPRR